MKRTKQIVPDSETWLSQDTKTVKRRATEQYLFRFLCLLPKKRRMINMVTKQKQKMNNPKFWAISALHNQLDKLQSAYVMSDEQKEKMNTLASEYITKIEQVIKG